MLLQGGDDDDSRIESDNIDWTTEDELEIDNFQSPSSSSPRIPNGGESITGSSHATTSSAAGPSNSKVFDHFIAMGFSREIVSKAIQEHGEEDEDKLIEALLTYSVLEKTPDQSPPLKIEPDPCSAEDWDDLSDVAADIFSSDDDDDDEETTKSDVSGNNETLVSLVKMGFEEEEALIAIERLGPESSLEDLVDFIDVAQKAKEEDALLPPEEKPQYNELAKPKKRRFYDCEVLGRRKKPKRCENLNEDDDDDEEIRLPNPMIGFGVPNEPSFVTNRRLSNDAMGPPYFYFENVAMTNKGVWQTISRFLYDVEPEFVDSKHFCAAARKRGYVHNLPIANRFPLLPQPPRTIHDAFPLTRKWWPSWDPRTKLNCVVTVMASAKLTERIRKDLENYVGDPPEDIQKKVLYQCKKWNLVWVGRNKVAPLEPDEVEMLLGFPRNHTRGGGISRTDRFKSLGNSFQVDTVAYHLSVLKEMYPKGINLLSLFSGIGGAEVALHRLGIPLNNVVSVEKSEVNRNLVRSWWEQTNQKGNLIDLDDVQQLDGDRLEQLMSATGGFDLIVGGSPCNNLTGSNRVSRVGLEGKDSSLFFDYCRILDLVKCMSVRYR